MFIGDLLCYDHKVNKCLLLIERFEMEALPTRFLSDCKSFLFLILYFFWHFVHCSNEECNLRVNTFILILVRLY